MKDKNQTRIINKKASYNYELIESFTAGICLKGTEIKSIKESASTAVSSTKPSKESTKVISEEGQVADRFRKLAGILKG